MCMWKQRITLTLEVRFRAIVTFVIRVIDGNDMWQLGSVKRHMNGR